MVLLETRRGEARGEPHAQVRNAIVGRCFCVFGAS